MRSGMPDRLGSNQNNVSAVRSGGARHYLFPTRFKRLGACPSLESAGALAAFSPPGHVYGLWQ
jgi:hypothetical protein